MMINILKDYRIVLASQSPRRKELLSKMDIEFDTIHVNIDESIDDVTPPVEAAIGLSEKKAMAIPIELIDHRTVFITADTIVAIGDRILGKPSDASEAAEMLQKLSAKEHNVITGVSLRLGDRIESFHAISRVGFCSLSASETDYYIEKYKPFDKAGSYGIQEWIGVIGIDHLEGSYFNVMGLPTQMLWRALGRFLTQDDT